MRIDDLELLKAFALDISSGRSRGELYSIILSNIVQLLDCDIGGIGLLDESAESIFVPLVYGVPDTVSGSVFKLTDNLFANAISSGAPKRVQNYRATSAEMKSLVGSGTRSVVVVSLKGRGKTAGTIWASRAESDLPFTEYELILLESIGGQAAIAVDNILLFEQQQFISDSLQRGFLTQNLPRLTKTDIGIFYASATAAAVVGGDFYDAIKLTDDQIVLFVGDVSGKGVTATAEAAMGKYSLRALAAVNPSPSYTIATLNTVAAQQLTDGHFITMVYSLFNAIDGSLVLCVAGHPYPLLYTAETTSVSPLVSENPAITILPDFEFTEIAVTLKKGDILAFYTDGIIELRNNGKFFGMERLGQLLVGFADLPAQEIADRIIDSAKDFAEGHLTDDIVLMVIKRTS